MANETLLIEIEGPGSEDQIKDLEERLRDGGLRVEERSRHTTDSRGKTQGVGTVLAVILSSAAVVELVRSIHAWIRDRAPQGKIVVRRGDLEVVVEVKNPRDLESFTRNVLSDLGLERSVGGGVIGGGPSPAGGPQQAPAGSSDGGGVIGGGASRAGDRTGAKDGN